jgi:hypothetical protein
MRLRHLSLPLRTTLQETSLKTGQYGTVRQPNLLGQEKLFARCQMPPMPLHEWRNIRIPHAPVSFSLPEEYRMASVCSLHVRSVSLLLLAVRAAAPLQSAGLRLRSGRGTGTPTILRVP